MARNILISGSIAYDNIMNFPDLFRNHFVADKLHNINVSFNVSEHNEHFGGTAGNIAYNLKLLGEDPTIVATGGRDFARYEEHLRQLRIDTSSIHRNQEKSTSFAYILTDKGDNQIAGFHLGAGGTPYGEFPTKSASLAIIGPGCFDDMRDLPEACRKANVPFFFDPGQVIPALPIDSLRNGFKGSAAVFGNDYEFSMLFKRLGWSEKEKLEHTKMLVITLGEKGTRVVTPEGEIMVAAVPVKEVLDPTGAGDSYRAGFIKGYLAGLPPETCAKIGSAVAVYCIETRGTQEHRFSMTELAERYEQAYGDKFPL
jgi:adenosine kinase